MAVEILSFSFLNARVTESERERKSEGESLNMCVCMRVGYGAVWFYFEIKKIRKKIAFSLCRLINYTAFGS